jgi:hypothetical protein
MAYGLRVQWALAWAFWPVAYGSLLLRALHSRTGRDEPKAIGHRYLTTTFCTMTLSPLMRRSMYTPEATL